MFHQILIIHVGCLRVFGSRGAGNGQFNVPVCCAVDDEGNLVVSEHSNHRIQVLRYSDDLRTIGSQGAANGQFSSPMGIAFDGAGHILVAEYSYRVQMLRYSDGAHVRTIGSYGSGNGQFQYPMGIVVDGQGRFAVCEYSGHRVQVLE